jgi:hypothetical protein
MTFFTNVLSVVFDSFVAALITVTLRSTYYLHYVHNRSSVALDRFEETPFLSPATHLINFFNFA